MKFINHILNDHLYNNSLWLIADSIMLTVFGFFFWTINARLYSSEQVGLASTLIAAAELLVAISLLGFDVALIKYIQRISKKTAMINSCFSLASIIAFLVSLIFILKIDVFSPKLNLLEDRFFGTLFVIFVIFDLLFVLMNSIFIGLKIPKFTFIQDTIFSVLKIIFPFILTFLGAYGIFSSWMISIIISFIVGVFFLKIKLRFEVHKKIIKKILKFSIVNYLSNHLGRAPRLILPLMITNLIDAKTTAYFYIAWMISSLLFVIPASISKSLLAQTSKVKDSLKINVKKSVKFVFSLLMPAVIVIVVLSKYLLLLFGNEYSENASKLLQILALSSIPYAINVIYLAIKNVQHKIKSILIINLIIAVSVIGLSYIFLDYGIVMIGLSWLITQLVLAIYTTIKLIKID